MGKDIQQQVTLNLISEGTSITGDLMAKNDIRIDGTIKGKINTTGRLVIGPAAKVEGEIQASVVDLLGTMEGNIMSSGIVSLKANAIFTGTIKSTYIAIESGAIFNGECQIERKKQS